MTQVLGAYGRGRGQSYGSVWEHVADCVGMYDGVGSCGRMWVHGAVLCAWANVYCNLFLEIVETCDSGVEMCQCWGHVSLTVYM